MFHYVTYNFRAIIYLVHWSCTHI